MTIKYFAETNTSSRGRNCSTDDAYNHAVMLCEEVEKFIHSRYRSAVVETELVDTRQQAITISFDSSDEHNQFNECDIITEVEAFEEGIYFDTLQEVYDNSLNF